MMFRRILIISAIIVAILLSVNICLHGRTLLNFVESYYELDNKNLAPSIVGSIFMERDDLAEACYPYYWQKVQRERLRGLLLTPTQAPMGNDELAQAQYFQYALKNGTEEVYSEGIRREPNNALYHYLLADMYLKQGLSGKGPVTDKQTNEFHYDYTITDRKKLDMGMQELAAGLQLPFISHRDLLLREQLLASPPVTDSSSRINELFVLADMKFPEYSKMRNFARVNGFYLSTLFAEDKRKDAEPYLYAGERLVVQLANNSPTALIGQINAISIGDICKKYDARACRDFGFADEAAMIEAHQEILTGKLHEWKNYNRDNKANQEAEMQNAGLLGTLLLPTGTPKGEINNDSLRPARMAEYMVFNGVWASGIALIFFMLMLFAGLKYWCWKIASRGNGVPAPWIELSPAEWKIVFFSVIPQILVIMALPFIFINERLYNYGIPFWCLVLFLTVDMIVLPIIAASSILRHQCNMNGIMPEESNRSRWRRLDDVIGCVIWCALAMYYFLFPITKMLFVRLLTNKPQVIGSTGYLMMVAILGLTIAILIPARWERKHPEAVPLHLVMSRSMITVRTFAQTHPTAQIVGLRSSFFRYSFHNAAYAP